MKKVTVVFTPYKQLKTKVIRFLCLGFSAIDAHKGVEGGGW
jgi:hypothetical protein